MSDPRNHPLVIPSQFAADTIRREGEAGRAWIEQLPVLIQQTCERWDLMLDGPLMHGYIGVVAPVRYEGEPCALKVSWIDHWSRDESAALLV